MPWFSLPMFALAGALAALAVVVAHLISSRTRAPRPLPTVRFIESAQQRSAAIERRPRDIALLLLRAGALLAAGLALAGPRLPGGSGGTTDVVIADFTNAASRAAVRDSAVAAAGGGLVVHGGSAQVVAADELPLERASAEPDRGALTAALVTALRQAGELTATGSAVRLSIVSPFTRGSFDSATLAVRSLWPGRVRLIPVAADSAAPVRGTIGFRGDESDPLRPGVLRASRETGGPVLIARDGITSADSAAAREGAVVVNWPRAGVAGSFDAPRTADTAAGIWVGAYTWIAPLLRHWPTDARESANARVPARWLDGTAAVAEHVVGEGCIRDVGIGVPDVGDLVISEGFAQLMATLSEPCGGARTAAPLTAGELRSLSGEGADAATIRVAGVAGESLISRVLLVLAVAAVLGELLLRRRA